MGKFIPYGNCLGHCVGSVVVKISSKRTLKLHQKRWRMFRKRSGAPRAAGKGAQPGEKETWGDLLDLHNSLTGGAAGGVETLCRVVFAEG